MLAADIKRYEAFLHDTAFKLPGVTHIRSSVVLKEVKAETALPIRAPAAHSGGAPAKANTGCGGGGEQHALAAAPDGSARAAALAVRGRGRDDGANPHEGSSR